MFRFRSMAAMLSLLLGIVHPAWADDLGHHIAMQGNGNGATACIACHGAKGKGRDQEAFPRIAGLNQAYLEKQLHDFAKGTRRNDKMQPIAQALTANELKAVTDYYSHLSLPDNQDRATSDPSVIEAGRQLAENGDWPHNIPACFTCHGVGGMGIAPHFPALVGQHESYIVQQLQAWKLGNRNNDPDDLMKSVARRLTHDQIMEVASYMASLKPMPR